MVFNNRVIFITGGTGSWGNKITKQLLSRYSPKEIRIYSRGEQKHVEMRRRFNNDPRLKFIIGDVRDKERLLISTQNVDYILHLAALKHLPICEENPWEAVLTNIKGTRNVITAAIENNIKKMIFVSTDKACEPLNFYGVTKSCAEKIVIAANKESKKTRFICIRAGNVIGTSGSVIPLFREQILNNNAITLTDDEMTRFLVPCEKTIELIFKIFKDSVGGEIFVPKMPIVKIIDIAKIMINELGNEKTEIKKIGIRPGEKIHELLISKYEIRRCLEEKDHFIILPEIFIEDAVKKYSKAKNFTKINEFSSNKGKFLNSAEIKELLLKESFLAPQKEEKKEDFTKIFEKEGWINIFKRFNKDE